MGQFTKDVTDSSWDADVTKSNVPVLVDFWAEWCPPCKALAPTLEEVAQEMGAKMKIVKLDVDNNQNAAAQFGIRSIPTMILFKGGQPVDQLMGKVPKDTIVSFITKHL
ncbi:MAG: thioredoxin [Oligoflexia bacterium]|nr:MAG: thioredoxin [Oligoflexia bacterium]